MSDENLIHVKTEYIKALQSKKDLLSLEIIMLRITKIIKNYDFLRSKELKIKLKMYQKIRGVSRDMKKLNFLLPKLKIEKSDKAKKGIKKEEVKYSKDLEYQLREIQEKLSRLNRLGSSY